MRLMCLGGDLIGLKLLKKGAEANLYLHRWHGLQVIIKRRIRKSYRHKTLDIRIRSYRTVHEAQMIHEARKAGVATPIFYEVDKDSFTIIMDYIEGKMLKEFLDSTTSRRRREICRNIGKLIARLHKKNIIHGDLTTSNLIESSGPVNERMLFLIDFGLSHFSIELEDRGVDLHLLKRALNSIHFRCADECFSEVITGYKEGVGSGVAEKVVDKVDEIERRGRYALRPSG